MTTMVDTIVSGLDTNWDAGILAKPSILDKFMNRDANWYASIKSIAIDSVLVEQHEDRTNAIIGVDGAGTYYTQARWAIIITIQTPGLEVGADGITKEDRLKALHDAVEDALSDMSGSGYLYRVFRTKDRTPKGGTTNKWMMDIYVEVTTPASSATLSGSGHALDSHSDVTTLAEAKGDLLLHNGTSWDQLSIGAADEVLTVAGGTATWAASVAGSDVFKTITGITNDVVADSPTDTLTLESADAKFTIVGTTATDTITFTVVEAQIDHDALTNFDANEHKLEAAIDHDALTNFDANEHKLEAAIDHDALTNFAAGEHFTMLDEDGMDSDSDTQTATQQSIKAYVLASGGTDDDAIHDNVAGEIAAIAAKGSIYTTDYFVIEDSQDSDAKKSLQFSVLEGDIDHDNLTNTHDLATDIDHDGLTNTHDLTDDVDHDQIANTHDLTMDIDHESILNGHVFTATANWHYPVGMGVPYLDGGDNDVDMEWYWDNTNLHAGVKVTVNDANDDGDWLWEIYLPDDFATFASDAIKYWYNSSDDTNAGVTMSVTDGTDTFTDGRQQATSWTQVTVTAAELTGASVASSAGSKLVIRVKADGDSADIVYIGGFDIFYNKA